MAGIVVSRAGGKLVASGGGDAAAIEEAVRAFIAAERAGSAPCLVPDGIEEARAAGRRLSWHPDYDRPAWPDMDPPLEIVSVWRPASVHPNCVVFYRCPRTECQRCHNPEAEWSSHHKTIRSDGLDAFGAAVEVETGRGKRRDTLMVLIDQPVFVPAPVEEGK